MRKWLDFEGEETLRKIAIKRGQIVLELAEVHRVSKSGALISVCPKRIDSERLKHRMGAAGFHLKERHSVTLIHDSRLEREVLNFVKGSAFQKEIV